MMLRRSIGYGNIKEGDVVVYTEDGDDFFDLIAVIGKLHGDGVSILTLGRWYNVNRKNGEKKFEFYKDPIWNCGTSRMWRMSAIGRHDDKTLLKGLGKKARARMDELLKEADHDR